MSRFTFNVRRSGGKSEISSQAVVSTATSKSLVHQIAGKNLRKVPKTTWIREKKNIQSILNYSETLTNEKNKKLHMPFKFFFFLNYVNHLLIDIELLGDTDQ